MLKKHYDFSYREPAQTGAMLFETTPTYNPEDTGNSPPDSPAAAKARETARENLDGCTDPTPTGPV